MRFLLAHLYGADAPAQGLNPRPALSLQGRRRSLPGWLPCQRIVATHGTYLKSRKEMESRIESIRLLCPMAMSSLYVAAGSRAWRKKETKAAVTSCETTLSETTYLLLRGMLSVQVPFDRCIGSIFL